MSLDEERRQDMIYKYLEKSDLFWKEAVVGYEMKMWSMTANRMYYATLNAVRALLLKDNHPTHSHNGTKQLFGQYYVITGAVSAEQGKLYSQLETMRERADYDCYFNATREDIAQKFQPTKSLIDRIKQLLKEQ